MDGGEGVEEIAGGVERAGESGEGEDAGPSTAGGRIGGLDADAAFAADEDDSADGDGDGGAGDAGECERPSDAVDASFFEEDEQEAEADAGSDGEAEASWVRLAPGGVGDHPDGGDGDGETGELGGAGLALVEIGVDDGKDGGDDAGEGGGEFPWSQCESFIEEHEADATGSSADEAVDDGLGGWDGNACEEQDGEDGEETEAVGMATTMEGKVRRVTRPPAKSAVPHTAAAPRPRRLVRATVERIIASCWLRDSTHAWRGSEPWDAFDADVDFAELLREQRGVAGVHEGVLGARHGGDLGEALLDSVSVNSASTWPPVATAYLGSTFSGGRRGRWTLSRSRRPRWRRRLRACRRR